MKTDGIGAWKEHVICAIRGINNQLGETILIEIFNYACTYILQNDRIIRHPSGLASRILP